MAKRKSRSKKGHSPVSKKISHLVKDEGVPQRQAVAMSLNMQREGRLTSSGGYRRAKRKGRKARRQRRGA